MQTYFDQLERVLLPDLKPIIRWRFATIIRMKSCWENGWQIICVLPPVIGITSAGMALICLAPVRLSVLAGRGRCTEMAKRKADVAFEFFYKLNVPYYCFHDVDVSPEGASLKEYLHNFAVMTEVLAEKQQQTGVKLLWGTANCFTHPRYGAGAATNPDPEVFARAATQVVTAMNATHQLGGENYVLWGGREGYESLLNTDLRREREQIGRFLQMVVEHKHKIGFGGTLLIEPKPQEPTKHQYDYDVATVYGFLKQFGLENEIKVNIEANHATTAGHSFHHEIASAIALGISAPLMPTAAMRSSAGIPISSRTAWKKIPR